MSNEAVIEKEIQAKGLTAPRITPAHIDDQIVAERYCQGSDMLSTNCPMDNMPVDELHRQLSLLTICVLVLANGFTVTGTSACASPENFDAEIGRKIARDNARQQIWALEGYQLRTRLANSV